jgi:hypothetical protein
MTQKKFLIAGGNSTLIGWDISGNERELFITRGLEVVEQVGFGSTKESLPYFQMMGNELSINGTLAFASTLGFQGDFYTSGISGKVSYMNSFGTTSIKIPLVYNILDQIVLFEGIGFIYTTDVPNDISSFLREQCIANNLPAFGLLLFKKGVMIPTVYVEATNSCVQESACGSGSVALSLLKDICEIKQPTGEVIKVYNYTEAFTISAKVVQIQ